MLKNKQKGFTLIELLVVIAIIGLLSTLAVVSLNSARQKARDARREADVKLINNAIQLYVQENNSAPTSAGSNADNVCDSSEACWNTAGGDLATALSVYTAPLVTDPTNTGNLVYVYVSPAALSGCATCNNESYQLYVKELERDASTWGFNDSENSGWIVN
jgi:prepilin-type N-terminal cleavage/methylation domain-containing protein